MHVTDVFAEAQETLWARLTANPVIRVDSGRRGADLVFEVELAPGVDPHEILVLHEERALVLVRAADRSVLHRIPLDTPVGRPVRWDHPSGLLVTARPSGPAPVALTPALRPPSRTARLRAALARCGDRLRGLFVG
ncbi:hypothetical protein [Nocardiopsis sp. MG754419]|uniref:hypothetical protein n=1 Tax=Nocardiopsis sp. MG754419 TaxID=2259865 RepID=UPI001BADB500|nr:hypothetical protein [Nocardiopsis sp. MG754419]MBR8740192.1 hypothetical protein [Nocardiopsis sp. MG754419]